MNPEGVIKFQVEQETGMGCSAAEIADLESWRRELRMRGWLGCDPARYGGLGFGNLSRRMPDGTFLITASQTGHLASLSEDDYVRILRFDPARNRVRSRGLRQPSSETMTHLAVYLANPETGYVFHTHCPEIWAARKDLHLPTTDQGIEYGTVEMFYAVHRLLCGWQPGRQPVLAMESHPDGIITWGRTARQAGEPLLHLAAALPPRKT